MTTIILCWYASGWAMAAIAAKELNRLTLQDLVFSMFSGPLSILIVPAMVLSKYSKVVLWSRK